MILLSKCYFFAYSNIYIHILLSVYYLCYYYNLLICSCCSLHVNSLYVVVVVDVFYWYVAVVVDMFYWYVAVVVDMFYWYVVVVVDMFYWYVAVVIYAAIVCSKFALRVVDSRYLVEHCATKVLFKGSYIKTFMTFVLLYFSFIISLLV